MLIATTLNTLNLNEKEGGYSALRAIDTLFDAGFRGMDIPFFKYAGENINYGDTPFFSDAWELWAHTLEEYAHEKGIVFHQTHNINFNYFRDNEKSRLLDRCVDRAICVGEMLGARYTVLHPIAPPGLEYNRAECLQRNAEYIRRKAETAEKHNCTLLIENMISTRFFDGSVYKRYCDCAEELRELVETVNLPNVKICFDVGHSHYMSGNECEDLKTVKDYVLGVHLHDNDRWNDEHLSPFSGTVDWEGLCQTFAEIAYSGDFTYEIHYSVSRMPNALQPEALRSAYHIAEYLVRQIECFCSGEKNMAEK